MKLLNYHCFKVMYSLLLSFSSLVSWSGLTLLNVTPVSTFSGSGAGVGHLSLVIILSVNHLYTTSGASIRDAKQIQIDASQEYSDEVIKIRPRILRRRFSRQMSLLSPALQTMGCLPKFFCGMNSKKPTGATTTLNDLAYLIRFAMMDDLEDSSENKGKDDLNSSSDSEDEEKRRQNQKFEQLADEKLILEDPDSLNFIWKDMKNKIRNKLKDGKMNEHDLNQMLSDMEAESNAHNHHKRPGGGFFSGLTNLMRFGRSVDHQLGKFGNDFHNVTLTPRFRGRRQFWETEDFDEQMKLAARIGQASGSTSESDDQCTTTFNLCPYTVKQMKAMVGGEEDDKKPTQLQNQQSQMNWFENGQLPPKPTTTPNPMSHAIYLLNPESQDGRKPLTPQQQQFFGHPPPPSPRPTEVGPPPTRKPRPSTAPPRTILRQKTPHRDPEDDETGFDHPVVNYANISPSSSVKVVPLRNKVKNKEVESEEDSEEGESKAPPKFKSTSTVKVTKLVKAPVPGSKDKDSGEDNKSSEEEQESKTVNSKSPPKRQKIKIGLPRPKYSIKHKYRNRPLSTEQGLDKVQNQKKEAIAASDEESSTSSESKELPSKDKKPTPEKSSEEEVKNSSEEKPKEVKIAEKLRLNSKQPQKYKLKLKPVDGSEENESLEQEDEDQKKKKAEIEKSSEEGNTSEEGKKGQTSIQNAATNKGSEEEQESPESGQHPKPPMHPIKYSYYNKENVEDKDSNSAPTRPHRVPGTIPQPKPTPGGFLGSLFGGGKKVTRPPPQNSPTSDSENESQEDEVTQTNSQEEGDSSEEKRPIPTPLTTTTVPPPPLAYPVGVLDSIPSAPGTTDPPTEKKKDENRPIITDPDKTTPAPKFPILPRFPPPSRRPSTEPSSTAKSRQNVYSDDYASSKEEELTDADSSESTENKTAESKESSEEEDPNHVKNIFSKASISSLGEQSGDDKEKDKILPPPPPPISNWIPANPNETKISFNNISKSPNSLATLVTPTLSSPTPSGNGELGSDEDNDDTSEVIGTDSKEADKEQDEKSSEEITEKKPKKKKKGEDDEDFKEPSILHSEDDLPEIGEAVVVIDSNPFLGQTFPSLPAPALAPTSHVDASNEIKIPMSQPSSFINPKNKNKNKVTMMVSGSGNPSGDNKLGPDAETKVAPNAASPSSPGGLPSGGSPPSPNGLSNPAGNMNGMQGTGGNRKKPGSGGNANNGGEGGDDSSEEEVGKSSEEANTTSEEEDEEDGRTALKKKAKKSKTTTPSKVKLERSSKKEDKKSQTDDIKKTSMVDPTVYGQPHSYPPLPPIYRRQPQPTLMSLLMKGKPKTPKPVKQRLPKPPTTKDPFYSKPLSPKLVNYLRQTYGNSYVLPRKRFTTTTPTTTTPRPHKSKKRNSFTQTFESAKLGVSDVIHLDDEQEMEIGFSRRTGLYAGATPQKRKRKPLKVPPVYGRITFHG